MLMTMTITALETKRVMVDGQEPIMPQLPVDTSKKINHGGDQSCVRKNRQPGTRKL